MTEYRPILCVDFDGVIHSYERGWQNGEIYGTVTTGFFDWAERAMLHFRLVVYSSRSSTTEGRRNMMAWIRERAQEAGYHDTTSNDEATVRLLNARVANLILLEFAHEKPPAFLTIDDRTLLFNGDWSVMDPDALLKFKPWNVT